MQMRPFIMLNMEECMKKTEEEIITDVFQTRLEDLISESGKKISDLAAEIGIAAGSLSAYQNGAAEPGVTKLKKIANYFNVSTDYLLGGHDNKTIDNEAIKKRLGLSDGAISILEESNKFVFTQSPEVLSLLLENGFDMILQQLDYFFNLYLEEKPNVDALDDETKEFIKKNEGILHHAFDEESDEIITGVFHHYVSFETYRNLIIEQIKKQFIENIDMVLDSDKLSAIKEKYRKDNKDNIISARDVYKNARMRGE